MGEHDEFSIVIIDNLHNSTGSGFTNTFWTTKYHANGDRGSILLPQTAAMVLPSAVDMNTR